jgi:hypothetical protein
MWFLAVLALFVVFFRDLRTVFSQPASRSILMWMVVLLAFGTVFFSSMEGWSVVDAFYFSVVTVATVGYGDLTPTTDLTKMVTVVYIFFGLSMITVFASNLAKIQIDRLNVTDSELRDRLQERRKRGKPGDAGGAEPVGEKPVAEPEAAGEP